MKIHEVIIVGAGPAGMNAALILARCRRDIVVFDTNTPRNQRSREMHGYLTRDGMNPSEFRRIAREELAKYNVHIQYEEIVSAETHENLFYITNSEGRVYIGKKMLIATGILDIIPDIPGMKTYFGNGIFHCPYCDGYELHNKIIAVYGKGKKGFELALNLKTWSDNIILLTDGPVEFNEEETLLLAGYKIPVFTDSLKQVEGDGEWIDKVIFEDGYTLPVEALFICNGYNQQSTLGNQLEVTFTEKKVMLTDMNQQSGIPGLYIAGDADKDIHYVIVAAAEGAKAGTRINMELQKEEREKILLAQKELSLTL